MYVWCARDGDPGTPGAARDGDPGTPGAARDGDPGTQSQRETGARGHRARGVLLGDVCQMEGHGGLGPSRSELVDT